MSGYEEQLLARAEALDETSELTSAATEIHAGAAAAGVDPQAMVSLEAAIVLLRDGSVPGYQAGSREDRHPGGGYGSDVEFLEALGDAEDEIREWLHGAGLLQGQVSQALQQARNDLERGRCDLAAAYAMTTKDPCDGCHSAKAAAVAAAEAAIADAERRIRLCMAAAEILEPLGERLKTALGHLRQVPHDLGEAYELIHEFIRRGGVMPHDGDFIAGTGRAG